METKFDKDTLWKDCLERFIEYRHEYIEDLPSQRLRLSDKHYYRYKCRGNLFCGIKYDIENLIAENIVSDPLVIQKGRAYIEYVTKRDFRRFSTREDIDIMNEILDIMIETLDRS